MSWQVTQVFVVVVVVVIIVFRSLEIVQNIIVPSFSLC